MDKLNEPKPCPFCGKKARVTKRQVRFIGKNYFGDTKLMMGIQVICNTCKSRGPLVTRIVINPYFISSKDYLDELAETAIYYWNDRR